MQQAVSCTLVQVQVVVLVVTKNVGNSIDFEQSACTPKLPFKLFVISYYHTTFLESFYLVSGLGAEESVARLADFIWYGGFFITLSPTFSLLEWKVRLHSNVGVGYNVLERTTSEIQQSHVGWYTVS